MCDVVCRGDESFTDAVSVRRALPVALGHDADLLLAVENVVRNCVVIRKLIIMQKWYPCRIKWIRCK